MEPKKRLFLVDDDETNLYVVKRLLQRISNDDCEICEFTSGTTMLEALDKLKRSRRFLPDLIVTDLCMPLMDGHDILRAIKRQRLLRSIPVILFSTSDDERDISRATKLGALRYIVKPIEPLKFRGALEVIWQSLNQNGEKRNTFLKAS